VYEFVYVHGCQRLPGFEGFGRMQDLHATYQSEELFPLFANRLLAKDRPEYASLLRWLNLKEAEATPLALLARTGGHRATDSLEVFPLPERAADGTYEIHFFSHGIRYVPEEIQRFISTLAVGSRLYPLWDMQNSFDSVALALRSDAPRVLVGYCPSYLNSDLIKVVQSDEPRHCVITVEQVNTDAPIDLRLLCKLSARWPESFQPFTSRDYAPLSA
jgi:hypothetical protein